MYTCCGVRQEIDDGYSQPKINRSFRTVFILSVYNDLSDRCSAKTPNEFDEVFYFFLEEQLEVEDIWTTLSVYPAFYAGHCVEPSCRIDPAVVDDSAGRELVLRPAKLDRHGNCDIRAPDPDPVNGEGTPVPIDEAQNRTCVVESVDVDLKDGIAISERECSLSPLFRQLVINEVCADCGCEKSHPAGRRCQPILYGASRRFAELPVRHIWKEANKQYKGGQGQRA